MRILEAESSARFDLARTAHSAQSLRNGIATSLGLFVRAASRCVQLRSHAYLPFLGLLNHAHRSARSEDCVRFRHTCSVHCLSVIHTCLLVSRHASPIDSLPDPQDIFLRARRYNSLAPVQLNISFLRDKAARQLGWKVKTRCCGHTGLS